ncbi:uncharacterized acetyltransferase At3g50280-like, partial [Macadamia integrifolia]|uniref:uncharacterized acetyltransferase At3g50280-like n=1 Tax=Macadamia integrifolia TaxID=60698 RepID=UPI001C52CFDB
TLRHISRCSIKPEFVSEESKAQPFYLNPSDLAMVNSHYIQKGLLFPKPPSINTFIDYLKVSLSLTLVHFLPLTGHLVTNKQDEQDPPSYSISIDCKTIPGVDFVHAVADVTMADFLSPNNDVPQIVQSFFLLDKSLNHDGHSLPLLAVQVTELLDGIFIACSFNHVVGDGTSYWHFFKQWADICRMVKTVNHEHISRPPVLNRWFLDGHGPIISLPFSHSDGFVDKCLPVSMGLKDKFFHFSPQSIAKLKAKANAESTTTSGSTISSFQALFALIWRSVTRARRHLPNHQKTTCRMAINNRSRLNPPLSPNYFGNCIQAVITSATVGELLSHGIGWAAWLLDEAVNDHSDSKVRRKVEEWLKSPYQFGNFFDPYGIMMESSPRFTMYGCDFGWGQAEAVRSGFANKFDGKVSSYPGRHEEGSVDLEMRLPPETMSALEFDPEFMDAVSLSHHHQLH